MSSNYWQMKRQTEQFDPGKTLTQRVTTYIQTWEDRCYENGIPDLIPRKLAASGRAPSYKAIAVAILKNDHHLTSLGFRQVETKQSLSLYARKKRKASPQGDLFDQERS